jgi:HSP20 family protein
MSLFISENPLSLRKNNNSLLDELDNELFNHPLISFNPFYPYYFNHPGSLEKQISKEFDKQMELFKSVDFSPKINLSEDEKNYYIHADLPGLNKDQVKMELSEDNRLITISGERKTVIDHSNENETETESIEKANDTKEESNEESEKKSEKKSKNKNNKKYSRIECSYGKFSRSFSIPENADVNNIHAKLENGVLEVSISKIEAPKQESKRSIQIQ